MARLSLQGVERTSSVPTRGGDGSPIARVVAAAQTALFDWYDRETP